MRYFSTGSAALAIAFSWSQPGFAQDQQDPETAVEQTLVEPGDSPGVELAADDAGEGQIVETLAEEKPACELHVWPTENYLGFNSGLLSGFGIIGALADQEVHKNRVMTVKDLMKDYLGPEVQLSELNKIGLNETLKLDGYKIIVQPPTPSHEEGKENPEVKAAAKAMNKKIKTGERLSDSKADCYAELVTTHIFYHKAMMYGSNLFTGWVYRQFDGQGKPVKIGKGQVKNPLEEFPPKSEEMIPVAQEELRDAYAKDFVEYVEKKVFKQKRKRR